MRGAGEPSSQCGAPKGEWQCREELGLELGVELGGRAQDSSLCTATVMLSCFWIMMFLQGESAEGGELGQEQLLGVGSGQGNH